MNIFEFEAEIKDSWDRIASSFDKTRKHPWKPCLDFISTLSKDDIVGDFGCGNGRHLFEIASKCKQSIGIDISQNLLHIIQNKKRMQENIYLIQGNLTNIPLQNNSLDAVLYIAALHNIPIKQNRLKSLQEVYRVLKPRGVVLLSVWSKDKEKFKKGKKNISTVDIPLDLIESGDVFLYWNQDNLHVPRYYHLYEKEELEHECIQTGFKIQSVTEEKISSQDKPDNYFLRLTK